eukprot:scaffold4139_cov104-Isochrysis_galbana.AAC.1
MPKSRTVAYAKVKQHVLRPLGRRATVRAWPPRPPHSSFLASYARAHAAAAVRGQGLDVPTLPSAARTHLRRSRGGGSRTRARRPRAAAARRAPRGRRSTLAHSRPPASRVWHTRELGTARTQRRHVRASLGSSGSVREDACAAFVLSRTLQAFTFTVHSSQRHSR